MKKIFLVLPLLFLSACDGSSARGFWGPNAPTGAWDREQMRHCELYGNCDGGFSETKSCELYGNCDGGTSETRSCELYGNCE